MFVRQAEAPNEKTRDERNRLINRKIQQQKHMTAAEYNQCVDDYSDGVFRFILKNIKEYNRAKDIVQDAFEKLWINAGEVAAEKAKSYLFSTAYHAMIDIIRREKKQVDFEHFDQQSQTHSQQYSDLHEILHEALEKLPEQQRSVVLLRDYEGYSYKEIAEITQLSESQVKVYIYRARVFLKKYIGTIETVL